MTYSQVPPVGVCLPWWSGSCGGHGEGYSGQIVFHYILIVDLFNVEGRFRGFGSLDPEIEVIPSIFGLPELFVEYHIRIKSRNINNIF